MHDKLPPQLHASEAEHSTTHSSSSSRHISPAHGHSAPRWYPLVPETKRRRVDDPNPEHVEGLAESKGNTLVEGSIVYNYNKPVDDFIGSNINEHVVNSSEPVDNIDPVGYYIQHIDSNEPVEELTGLGDQIESNDDR